MERVFNLCEAGLWVVLGIVCLWKRQRIAGVAFLLFAASDVIESRTGAWWKPWWLFVWKAVCVAVLFICAIRYYRARRK